jgi:hypothetical protein
MQEYPDWKDAYAIAQDSLKTAELYFKYPSGGSGLMSLDFLVNRIGGPRVHGNLAHKAFTYAQDSAGRNGYLQLGRVLKHAVAGGYAIDTKEGWQALGMDRLFFHQVAARRLEEALKDIVSGLQSGKKLINPARDFNDLIVFAEHYTLIRNGPFSDFRRAAPYTWEEISGAAAGTVAEKALRACITHADARGAYFVCRDLNVSAAAKQRLLGEFSKSAQNAMYLALNRKNYCALLTPLVIERQPAYRGFFGALAACFPRGNRYVAT